MRRGLNQDDERVKPVLYCTVQEVLACAVPILICLPAWLRVSGAILSRSLPELHPVCTPLFDCSAVEAAWQIRRLASPPPRIRKLKCVCVCGWAMFWNMGILFCHRVYRSAEMSFKPGQPFLVPIVPRLLFFTLIALIMEGFFIIIFYLGVYILNHVTRARLQKLLLDF